MAWYVDMITDSVSPVLWYASEVDLYCVTLVWLNRHPKCRFVPLGVTVRNASLRAFSFCAVFLFRFINRNGIRRVQKEQFSSERNNFHGNKMAHSWISLISNRKGKQYEKIIRERSSKNTGVYFDQLLVFADRVIFFVLSRQSSNLSSWIPSRNGKLLLF